MIQTLESLGYESLVADRCLLVLRSNGEIKSIILLHVDDLAIGFDNTFSGIPAVLKGIKDKYPSKDLGPISCFLGMGVSRDSEGGVILSQEAGVNQILKRFAKWVSVKSHTPADHKVDLWEHPSNKPLPDGVEEADKTFPSGLSSVVFSTLHVVLASTSLSWSMP